MERPFSRRDLLGAAGTGLLGGLAGCSAVADLFPESASVDPAQQSRASGLAGRLLRPDGDPVPEGTVRALGRGGDRLAETTTGSDGRFTLEVSRPVWVHADADGHRPAVRAGRPGDDHTLVLPPRTGTAVLRFGGDVMFGRRFYEDVEDYLNPHFRIRPEQLARDHRRILSPIAPLLRAADLTSVNLETPLTTSDWRHPTKQFTFASHPRAGSALAEAGVDYAALGNNHAFDALQPGLEETRWTLDDAGIAFSGAGMSSEEAWDPALVDAGDLTVALLSCATVVGANLEVDWSADRASGTQHTVREDGETISFSDAVGVAEASAGRLADRVGAADDAADVVVVQIHGGVPYQPTPTDRIRSLAEAAASAGADLVVNHHPHVVGGLERLGSTVVAWSLGNLVFDQTVWESFPSYLFTAYVTADGVFRAHVDPMLLEGYVPTGVVGKPERWVTRLTAGRSGPSVAVTDRGLVDVGRERAVRTETRTLTGSGDVFAREAGWVAGVEAGTVTLGRDLLPTGTFESVDVDGEGYDAPLWRFGRDRAGSRPEFGYDGGGFRLRRLDSNSSRLILSNRRRIPVSGPLRLTGLYRTGAESGVDVVVNWYPNNRTSEVGRERWPLPATGEEWARLERRLDPPDLATHLNLFVRVSPPTSGTRIVDVDDLRLIEWANEGTAGGRQYDHLRVGSEATVRFGVASRRDREIEWSRLSDP